MGTYSCPKVDCTVTVPHEHDRGMIIYAREQPSHYFGIPSEVFPQVVAGYMEKTTTKIVEEIIGQSVDSLKGELSSTIKLMRLCINTGFTAGLEAGQYASDLRSYYENDLGGDVQQPTTYDFVVAKGISGVLTPAGEFIKCKNAEHHLIRNLPQPHECVYFSSLFDPEMSPGVVSFSPMRSKVKTGNGVSSSEGNSGSLGGVTFTPEQLTWLDNHSEYLDKYQQETIDKYL